ncbi:MAG: hypothetical protein ACOYD1_07695 [Candidatus Nanopelagicales bacterium]
MSRCWIEPNSNALQQIVLDEETFCAGGDVSLTEEQTAAAEDALQTATEVLSRLTGYMIHGPGYAVDQYVLWGAARRVGTTFRPLREVTGIGVTRDGDLMALMPEDWRVIGNSIFFTRGLGGCTWPSRDALEVTYRFGSTVTRGARATALYYARQIFLAGPCGDMSACQLPERVTSITREGISMTTLDPQTFLDRGLTGLIRVDEWLASYATRKAARPAGVFGVDSPPPVNVAVWCGEQPPVAVAGTTLEDRRG